MMSRPLGFYEARHANLNMCFVLFIEARLTKLEIDQAWYSTQLRHPFLRMELQQDPALPHGLRFQEKNPARSIPDAQFRLEVGPLTGDGWQSFLEDVANRPRQQSPEMWYIWLRSTPSLTNHELYFLFNHSGSDGPGVFAFMKTFLDNLEKVLSNMPLTPEASLEFLDLHARMPPNVAEIPSFHPSGPIVPAPRCQSSLDPGSPARFSAVWFAFDEQKTKSLLDAFKKHAVTAQAAFTCAEMLALALDRDPGTGSPLRFAPCILVDLRKHVDPPISEEHSVCGSSGMIWEQYLRFDANLWALVQETTRNINAGLKSKLSLKYRHDMQWNPGAIQFTFMNSSIGRVPPVTDQPHFKLLGAKLLAGAYDGNRVGGAWTIAHAYTVQACFNVSFEYTNPSLSPAWANRFARIMEAVLTELAMDQSENLTVGQLLARLRERYC